MFDARSKKDVTIVGRCLLPPLKEMKDLQATQRGGIRENARRRATLCGDSIGGGRVKAAGVASSMSYQFLPFVSDPSILAEPKSPAVAAWERAHPQRYVSHWLPCLVVFPGLG